MAEEFGKSSLLIELLLEATVANKKELAFLENFPLVELENSKEND